MGLCSKRNKRGFAQTDDDSKASRGHRGGLFTRLKPLRTSTLNDLLLLRNVKRSGGGEEKGGEKKGRDAWGQST